MGRRNIFDHVRGVTRNRYGFGGAADRKRDLQGDRHGGTHIQALCSRREACARCCYLVVVRRDICEAKRSVGVGINCSFIAGDRVRQRHRSIRYYRAVGIDDGAAYRAGVKGLGSCGNSRRRE